jgi:thymidylate synthase
MNGHIRSNDLFKATFANWWGISELQCEIAKKLDVDSGELIWVADSLHLYGSYFHDIEKFVEKVKSSEIEDRTYTYGFAKEFFIDGCKELLLEPKMPENKKELVRQRLAFLEK